jgi:hypothetical protein
MPKTTSGRATTITVRVGPNMKRDIQAYADAREMALGEFVRYAVWLYMESTEIDPNDDGIVGQNPEEI